MVKMWDCVCFKNKKGIILQTFYDVKHMDWKLDWNWVNSLYFILKIGKHSVHKKTAWECPIKNPVSAY